MTSLIWLAVFLLVCFAVGIAACGFVRAGEVMRDADRYIKERP